MANIYSHGFRVGEGTGPFGDIFGPVPDGEVWIIRQISVALNATSDPSQWYATLYPASGGGFVVATGNFDTASDLVDYQREVRWVLQPGDRFAMNIISGTISWYFGGYVLTAP